jgi:hypothetical protein
VRTPQPRERARWHVSLYPDAAEAGGSLRYAGPPPKPVPGGGDPERAQAEAARRAKTKVRRYCAANRLNRLGTLTYAGQGCHDPAQVRADAAAFFRQLRDDLGGKALPYLWVPEWHPGGHGLHLHFAVGRYIKRGLIEQAWGHGFVHIKLLDDLPVSASRLDECRLAARYLAKYVTKEATDSLGGLHRYEVAQGFQPRRQAFTAATGAEALATISQGMGRPPEYVWWSSETEDWQGPPAVWAQWAA